MAGCHPDLAAEGRWGGVVPAPGRVPVGHVSVPSVFAHRTPLRYVAYARCLLTGPRHAKLRDKVSEAARNKGATSLGPTKTKFDKGFHADEKRNEEAT
jgi:hypothetical protein